MLLRWAQHLSSPPSALRAPGLAGVWTTKVKRMEPWMLEDRHSGGKSHTHPQEFVPFQRKGNTC